MDRKILSALIGLAGVIGNNGKTENTDSIVRRAVMFDDDISSIDLIHKEKFRISPSCETCQTPCGNTSDYPLERYAEWTEEEQVVKDKVLNELKRIVSASSEEKELPELVYKAISYMGYDLKEDSYLRLLEEMKSW